MLIAETPGGLVGAPSGAVNEAQATWAAKTETCAPAAPYAAAGYAEIDRPSLRARLVALRDDLRARLVGAAVVEVNWLATLAHTETVLAALDREGA